jgi:4'-phosphopantetheinyl transferase
VADAITSPAGDVAVWHARVERAFDAADRRDRVLGWLSSAERDRYARFHRDADRDLFLLGRAMARTLVARALGCAPTSWRWLDGDRGRPGIDGRAVERDWSFNLAHSGGLVVCGVTADGPVGIDVENRRRGTVDPQIVRRCCSVEEMADIERHGTAGWQDRFLQYWTLKEALLKACGLGISVPLAAVAFDVPRDGPPVLRQPRPDGLEWAFHLEPVEDAYYVASAAPARVPPRRFSVHPFPLSLLDTVATTP